MCLFLDQIKHSWYFLNFAHGIFRSNCGDWASAGGGCSGGKIVVKRDTVVVEWI